MNSDKTSIKPKGTAMTQVLYSDIRNLEFQQNKILLVGGKTQLSEKKLSANDIQKMQQNYVQMFFGFTSVNWGNGKTLGAAWQHALEQMDAFVESKAKIPNHPMIKELIKYHKNFRKDWAKTIMTSPHAQDKLNENLKKMFYKDGIASIKQSKTVLDNMYKHFIPEQSVYKAPEAKSFELAKQNTQKLMQQIMIRQMMKNRMS